MPSFWVHLFISGNAWIGPITGQFNAWEYDELSQDDENKWCQELVNLDSSNNLEACQSACMSSVMCNAINYRTTGGCSLRMCPYPVRAPSLHEQGVVGYYKLPGIEILVCFKWEYLTVINSISHFINGI